MQYNRPNQGVGRNPNNRNDQGYVSIYIPYFIRNLFKGRTFYCQHQEYSCFKNAIQGFNQNFKYGLMIRAAITFIMVLIRRQKITEISIREFMRFPIFLGLQAFVYKFVLCLMRRILGNKHGWNAFIAGVLSGLTVIINKDVNLRMMLGLYLLVRAGKISYDVFEDKGYVRSSDLRVFFMGMFFSMFFSTLLMFDFEVWPKSKFQLLNLIWEQNNQPNDLIFASIIRNIVQV
eukprot:403342234